MTDFMNLTRALCAIPSGIVHENNDALFDRIDNELPLERFRWRSGDSHNGWIVPQLWTVEKAEIRKDGHLVYDGCAHPFGVASYSVPFSGTLSLGDLKEHLFSRPEVPDAWVWHCIGPYRPWTKSWGFSIPHNRLSSLEDGTYDVTLETRFSDGEMIVSHHDKPGRTDATVVFHSNTCHPQMASDGFAGTAVLIRLFQWLADQDTHFTYRLVLGPEHLGTVFYLRDQTEAMLNRYVCGVFAEVLGTNGPLVVGSTFNGDHFIDHAFRHVAKHLTDNWESRPFRQSIGNDETVWEAPGYEVPFLQINRSNGGMHFPEYHTSLDTPAIINPHLLDECFEAFKRFIFILENESVMTRQFDGLIALSNPEYDLYQNRLDPAVQDPKRNAYTEQWGYVQDCIIRYFDGEMSLLDIAERHDLPFGDIHAYLSKFEDKGLIRMAARHLEPVKARRVTRSRMG